jgi:putative membrane protein
MNTLRKFFCTAIAAITLLAPTAVHADENKPLSAKDKVFLQNAAEMNMGEIMMAKLALERSRNSRVKMVAKTILEGHRKAQQSVYKIAGTHDCPLPSKVGASMQAKYQELSRLRGRAFDKAYMMHQVKAHNKANETIMMTMEKADDSHVREYAAKQYGPITDHTAMIYNTAGYFGVNVGGKRTATNKPNRR